KAYQEKKDYPNAIYNLMFALNYEPDDVYAVNVLGRMFLDVGLNDRALRTFDQVLQEFDANDKFALLGKAEALEAMGSIADAAILLQNARKTFSTDKVMLEKIDGRLNKLGKRG
ncbi:MAG: tetratricopeptide repeat protein, partial [Candidatus Rifleibacteriota bacterium]